MKCLIFFGLVVSTMALPYDLLYEPVAVAEGPGNLVEELNTLGCKQLVQLVQAAGLTEQLTDNTLTVFAPNDAAIGMLPEHVVDYLGKNKTALQELLMYHAVADMKVLSSDLYNDETVSSADMMADKIRTNIYGSGSNKKVTADGARVVVADHVASNGVIHVIDRVMFPIPTLNIAQYLMRDNMYFSTLLDAVKAADLTEVFTGPGPLTLFAPDNAAFKKLPPGALDALLKNKLKLAEVLTYHVAMGTIYAEGLTPTIKTLNGNEVTVRMMGDTVLVNNAHVDYADRKVTNGVIHVIDQVLLPPGMLLELMMISAEPGNIVQEAERLGLKTLVSLVKAAGLEDLATSDTLTLMAPTDEAFEKLPKSILEYLAKNMTALKEVLTYHAIPNALVMSKDLTNDELAASADPMSDNIRFNIYMEASNIITSDGARVVVADHVASNGVIHVIDRVMFPIPTTNIVGWLSTRSTYFSTLIDAAKDAGLVDTLMGSGPFTLFAPDDAAFNKIPKATLNALLKDKAKLAAVLKYHVLPETLYSAGIVSNKPYITAEGMSISISVRPEKGGAVVVINGKSGVKYADGSATNGVVHVIDTVLLPPGLYL